MKAEVSKMLDIIINSLYTNRNIFLREVISNASDALDKIRFLYLTDAKEPKTDAGEDPKMDIRIRVDKENRVLYIQDGGVGMTSENLEKYLGMLGFSGTKNFIEKMEETQSKDASFIGQFGVGFYSVFLVAENVKVASKCDGSDKQWVWESKADGNYFLYEDPRGNTLGRGTEIALELKKDADEYLDIEKLKEIATKYSEFIHFPIYVQVEKKEKVPVAKPEVDEEEKPAEDASEKKDDEEGEVKEEGEDAEKKEEKEPEMEEITTYNWELVNENKPIWTRKPADISEEEYTKFYKAISKEYDDPMYYTHFAAEGEVEFRSILFIPGKAPSNLFDGQQESSSIRLYVRRVFITDEFTDLLPRYLSFIKGVVDSDDLPLNVSRELLQESRILKIIKKKLIRKSLGMFKDIVDNDKRLEEEQSEKKDEEKKDDEKKDDEPKEVEEEKKEDETSYLKEITYPKFWEEFGKNIRLGLIEDGTNRARLTKLIRYKSSKSDDKYISLEDYVDRMPEKQANIYYITGENVEKIKHLPVLEDALKRDVEVLYMTDAIDEYVVGHLTDFSGKKLVNLAKEGVKFDDSSDKEKKIDSKRKDKYEVLTKFFKEILGEKVTKVILTKRKTDQAVLLSSPQHGLTANMARIMKGQALGEKNPDVEAKRVLELNHLHPIVDDVFKRIQVNEKDQVAEDTAWVLFDTAALQAGFDLGDVQGYANRVARMVRSGLDIAGDAPAVQEEEYEIEEEEEEGDGDDADGDEGEDGEEVEGEGEAPTEEKKEDKDEL